MDIKPPPKRRPAPTVAPISRPVPAEPVQQPAQEVPTDLPLPVANQVITIKKRSHPWLLKLGIFFAVVLVLAISAVGWYLFSLTPKTTEAAARPQRVTIESGETATTIAAQLEKSGVVRNAFAMRLYIELSGNKNKLQAGGYLLSTSQSVQDIVSHIVSGKTDEFSVRILPGFTLDELADGDVKGSLVQQGFSEQEIRVAYTASYDHPLLASKPATVDLEGYIFPETYKMNSDGSLQSLFKRSFDELYGRLQKDGTLQAFTERNLTIHQAITLSSMVQKEVSNPADQPQVAQVFLKRLAEGQVLGSDVTYLYAAKKLGVTGTPDLDSPYNTRKVGGLPPGPISNMNYAAIQAVAKPAAGDFLYFVAGDGADAGKTFFSRTEEEHLANVAAHCHVLCR